MFKTARFRKFFIYGNSDQRYSIFFKEDLQQTNRENLSLTIVRNALKTPYNTYKPKEKKHFL